MKKGIILLVLALAASSITLLLEAIPATTTVDLTQRAVRPTATIPLEVIMMQRRTANPLSESSEIPTGESNVPRKRKRNS